MTTTEVPRTSYSSLRERTRSLAKLLDKRYDPPSDEMRSPLTIYKVSSLHATDGVVNISEDGGVTEVPVRHLGSYDPVVNDPVMVYKNGADWLVLGSVKRGQDLSGIAQRDFIENPILADELSNGVVSSQKLAVNSVTVDKIVDGAVERVKIAEAAINEALIDVGAITNTKIADNAITTPKIATNSIITDHLAGRIVEATNIVGGTITAFEIASRTIVADRIAANTITGEEIEAHSITANKLLTSELTSTTITLGNEGIIQGAGWKLDESGLSFWDNPLKQGAPSISLDADTGDAVFRGLIDGGTIRNLSTAVPVPVTINYPTSATIPSGMTRVWATLGSNVKYPTAAWGWGFSTSTAQANRRYGLRANATTGVKDIQVSTGPLHLATAGQTRAGVYVRGGGAGTTSLTGQSGYFCEVQVGIGAQGVIFYNVECFRIVGGNKTIFTTKFVPGNSQSFPGDYDSNISVGISAVGNRIQFFANGGVIAEVTDSSIASGHAGLHWYTMGNPEDVGFQGGFTYDLLTPQGEIYIQDGKLWAGSELYATAPFRINEIGNIEGPATIEGSAIIVGGSQVIKLQRTGPSQGLFLGFFEANGTTRTGYLGHALSGDNRMVIAAEQGGFVAIEGSSVRSITAAALTVGSAPNMFISNTTGSFVRTTHANSSILHKRLIRPMTLDDAYKILALEPWVYDRTDITLGPNTPQYGYIAEDVEQVDPTWVGYELDENDQVTEQPDQVYYDRMVTALQLLVRQQRDELDSLRTRVDALSSKGL